MRLLSYHNAMYLECWRFKQEEGEEILQPMTLAVQRIESLNPTRKRHQIVDPPENINGNFGLISSERVRVVARFDKEVALYVSERNWSSDQVIIALPSGGIELTYTANGIEETVAWILSFGDKAEIIEPSDIRERVRDVLCKSMQRYSC